MMSKTLMAMVALMLMGFTQAEYNVTHYCQLVKPGTKLPSLDSCENYYTCLANGQSNPGSCSSGQVFNKDVQQCGYYNCFDNPCQNIENEKFVASTTKCGQWHYCIGGNSAGSGTCPKGQVLDFEAQSCIHSNCPNNGGDKDCQIIPNGMFYADPEVCKYWRRCDGSNMERKPCPGENVFDPILTSCTPEYEETCKRIPSSEDNNNGNANGALSGPPLADCSSKDDIVGDTLSCSVYYKCEQVDQVTSKVGEPVTPSFVWKKYTCEHEYFDVISQECTSISKAKPYPNCDRCQFKTGNLYWVNNVNSTCSEYLTCSNGQKTNNKARDCGEGNFFNEDLQHCMIGASTLETYADNHGACAKYYCDENRKCQLGTAPTVPKM